MTDRGSWQRRQPSDHHVRAPEPDVVGHPRLHRDRGLDAVHLRGRATSISGRTFRPGRPSTCSGPALTAGTVQAVLMLLSNMPMVMVDRAARRLDLRAVRTGMVVVSLCWRWSCACCGRSSSRRSTCAGTATRTARSPGHGGHDPRHAAAARDGGDAGVHRAALQPEPRAAGPSPASRQRALLVLHDAGLDSARRHRVPPALPHVAAMTDPRTEIVGARRLVALWAGILVAPAAFAANLQLGYMLVHPACLRNDLTPLHVVQILCLAAALGGGLIAWRALRWEQSCRLRRGRRTRRPIEVSSGAWRLEQRAVRAGDRGPGGAVLRAASVPVSAS